MRRNYLVLMIALALVSAAWGTASAKMFDVGGKPATIQGYISQSVGYSLEGGDYYDVEEDFNQALMNVFLEGDVKLSGDWSFYAAGMLTVDWMYNLKSSDSSWNKKRFDKSRDALHIDDEWWQLLKEAHFTWTPGDFIIRIGKQNVRWGEMMALAVNDVIMPTDNTHGLAEVELETLYVPITLINASYGKYVDAGPFEQMDIQFVFNPNVDFIPSIYNVYGNDQAGIWAADVLDTSFFGFPIRIGRDDVSIIEDPDSFDPDYFEYGLRFTATTQYSIFSLSAFYGRNNWASTALAGNMSTTVPGVTDDTFLPDFSDFAVYDTDGNPVVNIASVGIYPREKFVGAGWSVELPISSSSLGGFNPMLDVEVSYRFDDVFLAMDWMTGAISRLETDMLVVGVGMDWKVKVPWQKGFFGFRGEAQYNQYDDGDVVRMAGVEKSWWNYYFETYTNYKKWDLDAGIWVYGEQDGDIVQIGPYISWTPNSRWSYSLSGSLIKGSAASEWGFHHKDTISLNVTYQF